MKQTAANKRSCCTTLKNNYFIKQRIFELKIKIENQYITNYDTCNLLQYL